MALAAVLSQNLKPIASFVENALWISIKTLICRERTSDIIEAVRYWKHFIKNQHLTLKTDQTFFSFVADKRNRGKIMSKKIHRWRMELPSFIYQVEIISKVIHLREYALHELVRRHYLNYIGPYIIQELLKWLHLLEVQNAVTKTCELFLFLGWQHMYIQTEDHRL